MKYQEQRISEDREIGLINKRGVGNAAEVRCKGKNADDMVVGIIWNIIFIILMVQRKLSARSDRVKSVDLHSKEPWMLASLYNGNVHVWNHETQVSYILIDYDVIF